jgi:pantoate--beta-alanine ligase
MQVVHTVAQVRAAVASWRKAGQRVAFVPTMGNLHRGHIELIAQAGKEAQRVVSSVFVNPIQFGPNEDFDRYPRTLAEDTARLEAAECDLLFAPPVREIYPRGIAALTRIHVPEISTILCGKFRPGHFDGVATVVNLLLNIVQPDVALFGQKDYQQLEVIRRMVRDLHLPVEIIGVLTQREVNGLALSSRNQYLSPEEREKAPEVYATLAGLADALRAGRRDYAALEAEAAQRLTHAGFRPQYVAVRAKSLAEPDATTREFVVLAAAYLGETRLIDNLHVALV